jgi:hypothetical protein
MSHAGRAGISGSGGAPPYQRRGFPRIPPCDATSHELPEVDWSTNFIGGDVIGEAARVARLRRSFALPDLPDLTDN